MKIFVALLQLTLAQHLRWFTKCPEPAQMDSFDVPAVSSHFSSRLDFSIYLILCALGTNFTRHQIRPFELNKLIYQLKVSA